MPPCTVGFCLIYAQAPRQHRGHRTSTPRPSRMTGHAQTLFALMLRGVPAGSDRCACANGGDSATGSHRGGPGQLRAEPQRRASSHPPIARGQEIAAFLRDGIREQSGDRAAGRPRHQGAVDRAALDPSDARRGSLPADRDAAAKIVIAAADDRGLFWGVQTLRQLLPATGTATLSIPAAAHRRRTPLRLARRDAGCGHGTSSRWRW